ncbi:MAG: hypothetical protein J6Z79_00065 [Clostridia bacterium]|nr:hypothetical protein [Clostridia bacterium]
MDNKFQSRTLRSVRPQEPIRLPIEKKGKPVFWWIFGGIMALLCIAFAVFLIFLNRFLTAYEAAQPIHEAQALFDRCFTGNDFSEALKLWGFEAYGFEDAAVVSASLREMGEGKELVFYQVKSEEGRARYHVSYADPIREEASDEGAIYVRETTKKIAAMNFVQSDEDLGFGFRGWKFDSLEMDLVGKESVTAIVPRGMKLTLNGRPISENYLVATEKSPYNEKLPAGAEGIYFDKYHVEGLYRAPQLACADAAGNAVAITQDKNGDYRAELSYRQDLQEQYADFVRKGMEAYACFIQADGGIGTVAQYFDTNSQFYKDTRLNPGVWVIDHKGYYFKDEVVDHFYAYSDDVISCRVKLDQVLTQFGGAEEVYPLRQTVFLHKVNGTFRIYDRYVEE